MEIRIVLSTKEGQVVSTFKPEQIEDALQLIRSYVEAGKLFTVNHQRAWHG